MRKVDWSIEYDSYRFLWELMIWNRGSLTLQERIQLQADSEIAAMAESRIILRDKYNMFGDAV
jgi:hypothetical protein